MAKQGPKSAVPKLRFPEFRCAPEWETHALSRYIASLDAGVSVNAGDRPALVNEIGVLKTSCVTNGVFDATENKVVYEPYESARVREPVKANTIIISRMNTIALVGANAFVEKDIPNLFLPDRLWAAKATLQGDIRFLACVLSSEPGRASLSALASGSSGTMKNIGKSEVLALQIQAPSVEEQGRIADCLTSLDEVIAAQGRKVELLKAHKRGLMQQLFPREGETRPRLRFPEFRDAPEWRSLPLGEISEIKLGKMLDSNKHRSGHLLPYVNNISLRWNEVDTSDLPKMYFRESELERFGLQKGDVLVCEGGEPGRSAVWDGRLPDLKFQKAIHRVRFHVPFVPKILVLYLEAIAGTNAFESLFTGGGIKHLTGETFAKLTIPVMPLLEQQRIADCLSSLDTQITAETHQLTALKAHKQGLMQQLFPAPEAAA